MDGRAKRRPKEMCARCRRTVKKQRNAGVQMQPYRAGRRLLTSCPDTCWSPRRVHAALHGAYLLPFSSLSSSAIAAFIPCPGPPFQARNYLSDFPWAAQHHHHAARINALPASREGSWPEREGDNGGPPEDADLSSTTSAVSDSLFSFYSDFSVL